MKVFGPLLDIQMGEAAGLLDEGAGAEEEMMSSEGPFTKGIAKESIELADLIGQRAAERGIPYRQAYEQIRGEFPDLWKRASDAVTGVRLTRSVIARGGRSYVIDNYESDPATTISNMAKELAASENISFRAALSEVARKHPNLVRRYHESVLGIDV